MGGRSWLAWQGGSQEERSGITSGRPERTFQVSRPHIPGTFVPPVFLPSVPQGWESLCKVMGTRELLLPNKVYSHIKGLKLGRAMFKPKE